MSATPPPSRPVTVTAPARHSARQLTTASGQEQTFRLALYHPNYMLPAYFTFSPDKAVFRNETPSGEGIKRLEFKYQLSVRLPIVRRIAHRPISVEVAYTQKSYWQAYNRSAFFRETDYEPEIFLAYRRRFSLPLGWTWTSASVGAVHQSNGKGGTMERSWNRIYVKGQLSHGRWHLRVQPWLIIHDSTMLQHNPDIGHYLGYGRWILSYRWGRQSVALLSRNNLTSGFSRGFWQLSWSFPLFHELTGYVQASAGYGQSLIEYDHSTTAVGIGIALNNW